MTSAIAAVAAGGALGSVARFLTVTAATHVFGVKFPLGTVLVNVVGSFAIGFIVCFMMRKFPGNEALRYFLTTGFLGGFTTFSAFSLDVLDMLQRGDTAGSVIYVIGTVGLALIGVLTGYAWAQAVTT
jgi:fluoride exporter